MKQVIIALIVFFGILFGLIIAAFGGLVGVAAALATLAIIGCMIDYRCGVVLAILIAPLTSQPIIAKVFLFVLGLTTVRMVASKVFGNDRFVLPPLYFVYCYLLPICVAVWLGVPHLSEAYRVIDNPTTAEQFTTTGYIKNILFNRMTYILMAVLVANMVFRSKSPEKIVIAVSFSGILVVVGIFGSMLAFGIPVSALGSERGIPLMGAHANEVGYVLVTAAAPLMFIAYDSRGWVKAGALAAFSLLVVGLLATYSRGAYLAFLATVVVLMIARRSLRLLLALLISGAIVAVFIPESVYERVASFATESAVENAASGNLNDPATAGRIGVYIRLAPEILKSPLWGSGAMSTAWSNLVQHRVYRALHPHNLYLEILLDTGVIGFTLMTIFVTKTLRHCNSLARDSNVNWILRSYMAGLTAAFVGMLFMGLSNGHWLPLFEQSFLWIGIGVIFGMMRRMAGESKSAEPDQRLRGGYRGPILNPRRL